MKIRTLIVDDMPLARKRIRRLLSKDLEIEIIGECNNGFEAVEVFEKFKPQLVFLDVQMPEKDGFEILKTISSKHSPTIIFVTAYDQFAIQAFEVNAFDYLLKPFSQERLEATLKRAKEQIKKQVVAENEDRLVSLLAEFKGKETYLKRLTVKERGKIIFVPIEDIDFIEAQGNYLELFTGEKNHLIRMRLHYLEAKLDPNRFVKIHRSIIINIDKIQEMKPLFNGDQTVILTSGKKLTMTRNFRDKLKNILGEF